MESMTYTRKTTRRRDGARGVMFVHTWSTGRQVLIFPSLGAAYRWAIHHFVQFTGPRRRARRS